MSDPQRPGPAPVVTPVAPPPRHGVRLALLLLVLAALCGYGGWRLYLEARGTVARIATQQELLVRVQRDLAALRAQTATMGGRQGELMQIVRQQGDGLAALGATVEGGRARLQLAAVEQLLLLANDRLLLARDAGAAIKALESADQRLATLADPRLLGVRQALAAERAALATVTQADVAGASLALAEILRRAPRYPLRARVPEHFEPAPQSVALSEGASGWQRVWAALRAAVGGIFTLRRTDGPPPRLLAPEQEALVPQILELKLEGARLALLASDAAAFRDLTAGSRQWLLDYYNGSDPSVRAALADLERLSALDLTPALPDITRSLTLLRAHLQASPQ